MNSTLMKFNHARNAFPIQILIQEQARWQKALIDLCDSQYDVSHAACGMDENAFNIRSFEISERVNALEKGIRDLRTMSISEK